MLLLQNKILELIARGDPFEATLRELCVSIERLAPDLKCAAMISGHGRLIQDVVAASISPELRAKYMATAIRYGPSAGSSATVGDAIQRDLVFETFASEFAQSGIAACWSISVGDALGAPVATLAFYFPEARGPTASERALMEIFRHLFTIAHDNHERTQSQQRRACIDNLTGLANRRAFDEAISAMPRALDGAWALFIVDLDNLKVANDTFGHDAGDALIRTVAGRLAAAMPDDATFRLGGDEFAVILQCQTSLADLDCTARHILKAIAAPAACQGHTIVPQATIGSARSLKDTPDAVQQNADIALYHAKETARGGHVCYSAGIKTRISSRRTAILDLSEALQDHRVSAYYQPIVRLDSREIVGMEALCRLRTRDGKIIAAAAFQDATSDARVASALTSRMLAMVSDDARRWLDEGIPLQKIGINVTTADLHGGKLLSEIQSSFGRKSIPLGYIVLEINETVYVGPRDNAVTREIARLRSHGLSISLDDFGTGFASLTHLRSVPANNIKIDRSFVMDLERGNVSSAIVGAVVGLARTLGMPVVVEGIETADQARQLQELGCILGQGYLYSRPVDRETMTGLLRQHSQGISGATPLWIEGDTVVAARSAA